MTYWTKEILYTNKPIIAMCHLQALPPVIPDTINPAA